MKERNVDITIFGGGVAGLWTLNHLVNLGYSTILIEKDKLGKGQTISCQGIVHGGIKYALSSDVRPDSVAEVKDMPRRWQQHLSGERKDPDLTNVKVQSDYCHMWVSKGRGFRGFVESAFSPIGLMALNTKPKDVTASSPQWFKDSARKIYRFDEPVINTSSLLEELARPHQDKIFYTNSYSFSNKDDNIESVILEDNISGEKVKIYTSIFILTAGIGNQGIIDAMGLSGIIMQERPLRQVVVTGDNLPELYGHCIDGGSPTASVTTHENRDTGKRVWVIGGKIAEDGFKIGQEALAENAKRQLAPLLRGVDLSNTEWSTYDAIRAEAPNEGKRPGSIDLIKKENVYVCYPTKMALAPILAEEIECNLKKDIEKRTDNGSSGSSQPEIRVAKYPWETTIT